MTAIPALFTVELPSNPGLPGTLFIAWGAAAPADITTLTIDATLLLAAIGRTVVGTPAVTCPALTIANTAQNASLTSFQVSGGADGSGYGITWFATLDDGSTLTRVIWLPFASGSWNWGSITIVAKGDQGVPGPTGPGINAATVSGLSYGAAPTATVADIAGETVLVLGIPAGQPGANGTSVTQATVAAQSVQAGGTVTALAAVIGNTLVLDLGIPVVLPPISYQGTLAGMWNAASNSPSLGVGGAGGTAGQVLTVSVGGTTSITGTPTVVTTGGLMANVGGSAWIYQPNAGTALVATTLTLGQYTTLLDDGSGVPGWEWRGNDGGVLGGIYATGLSFFAGTFGSITAGSATFSALNAPVPSAFDATGNTLLAVGVDQVTVAGSPMIASKNWEIYNAAFEVVATIDSGGNMYLSGNVFSVQGELGGTGGSTFQPSDIAKFDAANLAYAASAVTRGNGGGMATTSNVNVMLHVGQSKVVGTDGNPPLSLTQPYDSVMLGQAVIGTPKLTTDPTYGTWTPAVDSLFHPAVSVYQNGAGVNGGLPGPVPTGHLDGLQNVSVVAGGSNGTITVPSANNPGVNLAGMLSTGNGFQMAGFTVATNNNAAPSNTNTFTVGTVTATTIICHEVPQATVAPESGITIAQVNWQGYGENLAISGINEYRRQQLKAMRVLTDPTRINCVAAPGVAQYVAAQMQQSAANFNILPNPYLFNRISGCLADIEAEATALGLTSSLTAIYVSAGGDESGGGVTKAQFRTMMATWMQQIAAQAVATFGATQTDPPFVYSFVVDGQQLNDGGQPSAYSVGKTYAQFAYCTNAGNVYLCAAAISSAVTAPTGTGTTADGTGLWQYLYPTPATFDPAPTTMGILEAFGCSPQTGYPWQSAFTPNAYLVGPDYAVSDRGGHLACNGYAWYGYYLAKVRTKVEIFKQGWLPCHVIGVYSRGTQILVCFSVPEPPLQIQAPYVYDQPTLWAELGFAAYDASGNISVTSATLAGKTCVLLNLARTPSLSSLVISYANSASYGGNGNICDSDTWVPLGSWQYTEGSSQMLTDNQTGQGIAKNNTPLPMWNWACPYQGPATAY